MYVIVISKWFVCIIQRIKPGLKTCVKHTNATNQIKSKMKSDWQGFEVLSIRRKTEKFSTSLPRGLVYSDKSE